MNMRRSILGTGFMMVLLGLGNIQAMAQAIGNADAQAPTQLNGPWVISVNFTVVPKNRIKQFYLLTVDGIRVQQIAITNVRWDPTHTIYSGDVAIPLQVAIDARTQQLTLAKPYELRMIVENDEAGKDDLYLSASVILNLPNITRNTPEKATAKSAEDADIYISGELNGAHKQKTEFSTKIKLQKYFLFNQHRNSWLHAPFFKLHASTDPDADPDAMELGWAVKYVTNAGPFDNKIKLESERDFGNTNLIYDTRFTFLPIARPKGRKNFKIFPNPFIGGEFGKNLHSPLKAAQGDSLARLIAGADVRLAFFLKNDSAEPEINWTTTYVRRWLLTDELSFEADDDGVLQLRRFGTNPRDYFSSKVSYGFTKFAEVFTEYEWGQLPPSYKLVDHRFRLGFAYRYKFGIKD